MNLNFPKDENLPKDKHLQKALQHAPDSDIAPSEVTRKSVLDYAHKALKTRHEMRRESWLARVKNMFNTWQIPSWQMTGMGSLAASLLVVVMIWHENPNDPIEVATAPEAATSAEPMVEASPEPSLEPKLAQNELTKDAANQAEQAIAESAPAVVSADNASPDTAHNSTAYNSTAPKLQEKTQGKLQAKVVTKTKPAKQETEIPPQAAPADKTVLARAPEAAARQRLEKDADSKSAKEAVVTAEVAPPAPVAAAPAPVSQSAPAIASAKASADAASGQAAARAAPMNKAENKAENQMMEAQQARPEAKVDSPSAASAKPAVPTYDSALVLALSEQGGQALANKDIQAGKFRILYLIDVAVSNAVDEATGYRKEAVLANIEASEESSLKSLAAQVQAYNQTMREWHLNH